VLRAQPEVDAKHIFLLGHSLGGNLAPRIAEEDGKLAGLVILAGNMTPIEDAIVEQSQYLGATASDLKLLHAQAAKVKALEAGDEDGPPVSVGPVTVPPSYWLDLKAYDVSAAAKKLTIPMLILQGERDYQVTMKDFALWKSAVGSRKNVTLRSYPALNHLFIAGEGKILPEEYSKPGHLAPEVIDDIAKFLGK
jgi:alpha-beta hydrolase superfamily lysophospholipase